MAGHNDDDGLGSRHASHQASEPGLSIVHLEQVQSRTSRTSDGDDGAGTTAGRGSFFFCATSRSRRLKTRVRRRAQYGLPTVDACASNRLLSTSNDRARPSRVPASNCSMARSRSASTLHICHRLLTATVALDPRW
jgi:hypothetical protein